MQPLDELHLTYDGPIPPDALVIAGIGFPPLALARARSEIAFFQAMALRQLDAIRMRRADGNYTASLLADLRLYREQFQRWNRVAAEMRRSIVAGAGRSKDLLTRSASSLKIDASSKELP
ncbi:MAG: hypothetical protein JWL84_3287 [Rhodospirillales bacterium]|nr:hypothetical protein [Rhodospirillales bacterium]